MINILFWCITVPGVYLGGMCLTYKILRKTVFTDNDDSDKEAARHISVIWFLSLPYLMVAVLPHHLIMKLFDMFEGEDE